ncbi:MAG: nucleotidyltransferase family protein [Anaerolineaceae bacterium]|nr:nucleotidyltransferase family protein [Anaerolineaceae bacterium]
MLDAIVTAGGKPEPDEPLYAYTRGGYKVLLELGGKPILHWVLEALESAVSVRRIIVVGLPQPYPFPCSRPLTCVPGQGNLMLNVSAACQELLRLEPGATQALLVSGDVPAITGAMIDWMAGQMAAGEADLYYPVIERRTMEARFPDSRRTYVTIRDRQYCGGDIIGIRPSLAIGGSPVWDKLIEARKSPLKQASLLGLDTLFHLIRRKMDLHQAEAQLSKRLGIHGRALVSPYAEIGMDIDKPNQFEILHRELSIPAA